MLIRLAAAVFACSLVAGIAGANNVAIRPPIPVDQPSIDRGAVRTALAARREKNLAAFTAYVKAGVYPHNFVRPGLLNVWLDDEGHMCAAATMIDRDGQHALVVQTAAQTNHLRLLDVTTGPLMDWMATSGLTIEEIDRIQAPGFQPVREDGNWRVQEDARLRRSYTATLAWLATDTKAGLDMATDRLMANPALAHILLDGGTPSAK